METNNIDIEEDKPTCENDNEGICISGHRLLLHVDSDLDSENVEHIKFFCKGIIGNSKLQNMKRSLEIFEELERLLYIDPKNHKFEFLVELLCRIHRFDLISRLAVDKIQAKQKYGGGDITNTQLFPLSILLYRIADDLEEKEVMEITFILARRFKNASLKKKNMLEVFTFLDREMELGADNVKILYDILQSLPTKRTDLVEMVEEYERCPQKREEKSSENPKHTRDVIGVPNMQTTIRLSNDTKPAQDMTTVQASNPDQNLNNRGQDQHGKQHFKSSCTQHSQMGLLPSSIQQQKTNGKNDSVGNKSMTMGRVPTANSVTAERDHVHGFVGDQVTRPSDGQSTAEAGCHNGTITEQINFVTMNNETELPSYKMDANPRGYAVVLNNRNFSKYHGRPNCRNKLSDRRGTEIDAEELKAVFRKLHFKVEYYEDLNDEEMKQTMKQCAERNHQAFDCFVCCILTHGEVGHVYSINGVPIRIDSLTANFRARNCRTLAGKPKLFFIQACQGQAKQGGYDVESDAGTELVHIPVRSDNVSDNEKELIPDEADFLLGYATVPGYISYRSKSKGSWYINALVAMLDKYARSADLLSIMVRVNQEVGKADACLNGGIYKQVPAPIVTLTKKVYFR